MAPDRIRLIQGIGPALMKEIERYDRRNSNTEQTAKRHLVRATGFAVSAVTADS